MRNKHIKAQIIAIYIHGLLSQSKAITICPNAINNNPTFNFTLSRIFIFYIILFSISNTMSLMQTRGDKSNIYNIVFNKSSG